MDVESKRSQNSYLVSILRGQTSLLEDYYEAAGGETVKQEVKDAVIEAAANLKSDMAIIQGLMGIEEKDVDKSDDKKTEKREESPEIEIAFLSGLEGKKGKK